MIALRFLVYSNLYIALAAALQVWSYQGLDLDADHLPLILFVFGATLCVYSIQRLGVRMGRKVISARMAWLQKNRAVLTAMVVISGILMAFAMPYLDMNVIFTAFGLALISVSYVWRPSGKRKPFREIGWLKISSVAFVWSMAVVGLVLVRDGGFEAWFKADNWPLWVEKFLFVFCITIPFDIRDMQNDPQQVSTLPRSMGIRNSQVLGTILALLAVTLVYTFIPMSSYALIWQITIYVLAIVLLWGSHPGKRKDFYYAFIVDGLLMLDAVGRLAF